MDFSYFPYESQFCNFFFNCIRISEKVKIYVNLLCLTLNSVTFCCLFLQKNHLISMQISIACQHHLITFLFCNGYTSQGQNKPRASSFWFSSSLILSTQQSACSTKSVFDGLICLGPKFCCSLHWPKQAAITE